MFDASQLHPSGAKSINDEGLELLKVCTRTPISPQPNSPFPSRRQPRAEITDTDIIGEIASCFTDQTGRVVGRYYVEDLVQVALIEDGYKQLRKLVEKLLRLKPFSRGFSYEFLDESIFKWWQKTLTGQTTLPLSTHLIEAAADAYSEHVIRVPLSSIEIESAFYFGDVLVTPFEPNLFDKIGEKALEKDASLEAIVNEKRQKYRLKYAHLTAVSVTVEGDAKYAEEKARNVAFDMAAVFRTMSPAASRWNLSFPCYPEGCQHVRQISYMSMVGGEMVSHSQQVLDELGLTWKIPRAEFENLMRDGFLACAVFFQTTALSNFQQRVKATVLAFSEGVASFQLSNRLIYTMSALEHLLLRDDKEPIQANVGDRMAFLISSVPTERQTIVANFRKAYGLRSKQVHHLSSVADEAVLFEFFIYAWLTMREAIRQMKNYKEKSDFLDAIDAIKFGG